MPYQIPKKPKLIKNAIAHQAKQAASSLTIAEWNHVVNVLKEQTNYNTEYLENLHRVLFSDWDQSTTGTVDFPDDNLFGYILRIVEELRSVATVYIGDNIPLESSSVVLWIDTGDNIDSEFVGISGGVFTSDPAEILTGGTFLSALEDVLFGGVF